MSGTKRARICIRSTALPASIDSRSFQRKRGILCVSGEARELSPPRLTLQYGQKACPASVQLTRDDAQAIAALNAIPDGKHHKSSHGCFTGQAHSGASVASSLPGRSAHEVVCRVVPVAIDADSHSNI